MIKLWLLVTLYPSFLLAYTIPILMYHNIDYTKNRYSVTPETFRSHLEKLYSAGYITAPLSDVLEKKPYLKKQKVVVLRFDGAKFSQFNYIKDKAGKLHINPKCAIGILLDFYKKHPSFGKHALFALLPQGFEQPEYCKKKLQLLLSQGMELCNHGTKHIDLTYCTPEDVDKEFGQAMAKWTGILGPEARKKICYVATAFGSVPKRQDTRERLRNYSYNGKSYPQKSVLFAAYRYDRIAPCPFSPEFDPYSLPSLEIDMKNFDKRLASFEKEHSST